MWSAPARGSSSCTRAPRAATPDPPEGDAMGLREWMSGLRRQRDPQRDQVPDMAEIRELARAASAYEQVPAAPGSDRLHRSGFVDVKPSPLDEREMDGAAGLEL